MGISWNVYMLIQGFLVTNGLHFCMLMMQQTNWAAPVYLPRWNHIGGLLAQGLIGFWVCHAFMHNDWTPCNVAGGLHVVDVSNPLEPKFAGCFGGDGYVHDAQCLIYRGPDVNYYGQEVSPWNLWIQCCDCANILLDLSFRSVCASMKTPSL